MDNCNSEPYKNLKEEDFVYLIEYIDICYRWVDFVDEEAMEKISKLVESNKSFSQWLKEYIFSDSYRLYVGESFNEEDAKKIPEVGKIVEQKGNKCHHWTTNWNSAIAKSEYENRESTNQIGGMIGSNPYNPIKNTHVVADMHRLFKFLVSEKYADDVKTLEGSSKFGKKFTDGIDRFLYAEKKVKADNEVITSGNVKLYEVEATWKVDEETNSVEVNGSW